MSGVYNRRKRLHWLLPPALVWHDPREHAIDAPLGRWNLYIGSAGTRAEGFVNLDLFALPGVDVAANAEQLPFPDGTSTASNARPCSNISSTRRESWPKSSACCNPAGTPIS